MRCVSCKKDTTRVVDSRPNEDGFGVVRQRRCTECGHRFATYESTFNPAADKQSKRERYARYRINRGDHRRAQQREYQSAKRAAKALGLTIPEVRELWKKEKPDETLPVP